MMGPTAGQVTGPTAGGWAGGGAWDGKVKRVGPGWHGIWEARLPRQRQLALPACMHACAGTEFPCQPKCRLHPPPIPSIRSNPTLLYGPWVQAGVYTLVLPAAHETVETWKNGFQFVDMPEDDCK